MRLLMCLGAAGCFWVSPSEQAEVWDRDQDGIERPQDCDDSDPTVGARVWHVDADGDGYVSKAEFSAYCQKTGGAPPTEAEWRAFYAADGNADGRISRAEFEKFKSRSGAHNVR